jgi:hypothetical protein
VVRLVGSIDGNVEVLGLVGRQLGQLDAEGLQVGSGHLFVELLRQHVHAERVLLRVAPQLDLGKNLWKTACFKFCEINANGARKTNVSGMKFSPGWRMSSS